MGLTQRQYGISVALMAVSGFAVLLAGFALIAVPLALIVLGAVAIGLSILLFFWDPERRTP